MCRSSTLRRVTLNHSAWAYTVFAWPRGRILFVLSDLLSEPEGWCRAIAVQGPSCRPSASHRCIIGDAWGWPVCDCPEPLKPDPVELDGVWRCSDFWELDSFLWSSQTGQRTVRHDGLA